MCIIKKSYKINFGNSLIIIVGNNLEYSNQFNTDEKAKDRLIEDIKTILELREQIEIRVA